MELHIKEFEYQNIIKQQFYRQLVVLSLYVLLLVFALESILYGFDYVWIILFVAAMTWFILMKIIVSFITIYSLK